MALPSNAFDLLGEESYDVGSLLSILEDLKAMAALKAAERKRTEEAERKRKEVEERASMARRLENRRRWFESQEQKKWQLEENQRRREERKKMKEIELQERKKRMEADEKLRVENPEKWEEERKKREKEEKKKAEESIRAALLGLLRPRPGRFSRSPSPHEFQRSGPVYKQGQVQGGTKTNQVANSTPSTLSEVSDIGSVSGSTTTTRPSSSDQTQGSQRAAAAKNMGHIVKPALIAPSLRSVSTGTNSYSQRAEATKINGRVVKPALIPASSTSVLSASTNSPSQREKAEKNNGPAVKADATSPSKTEAAANNGSDKAVASSSTTSPSFSSDRNQESKREEAKDNGTDGEGWQLVAPRRRRKQGSDRRSYPDQTQTNCNKNNVLELENGQTDCGHVNNGMNGSEVSTGVDGDSSTKSSDGRRRQNRNGSVRRKLKKKKAAEGEKKEGENNQKVDTSNVVHNQYTQVYTLKEYESLKKKRDDDNKSADTKLV